MNKELQEIITKLQAMAAEQGETTPPDGETVEPAVAKQPQPAQAEQKAAQVVAESTERNVSAQSDTLTEQFAAKGVKAEPLAVNATADITAAQAATAENSEHNPADDLHCYKSFELSDNITVNEDILKKSTVITFDYFSGIAPPLCAKLIHVYRPNSINSVFGNDFKLNICESLISEEYTDSLGDKYVKDGDYINGMCATSGPKYAGKIQYLDDLRFMGNGTVRDLQFPTQWLYNATQAKGFNKYGKLVFVCDVNKNYMHIKYNASDEIVGINQGNNATASSYTFTFGYTNNKLTYIKDSNNRRVSFEYGALNRITQITYPDGRIIKLDYNNSSMSIDTSDDYYHEISIGSSQVSVTSYPLVNRDDYGEADIDWYELNKWRITFSNKASGSLSVSIKDIDDNCEYYDFNADGLNTDYFKEVNSVVTYAEKRTYNKSSQSSFRYETVYIAPAEILNLKPYSEFNYNINYSTDEHRSTTYNEFNNPISDGLYNRRMSPDSFLSYYKSNEYDENSGLLKCESTTYCLYNIDDGQEIDHTYYKHKTEYQYDASYQLIKKSSYFEDDVAEKGKDVEEYAYNNAGQILRTATYNSLEPSKVFITEKTYDDKWRVSTEIDPSQIICTTYEYDGTAYIPNRIKLPSGGTARYSYDSRYRPTKTVLCDGELPKSNENVIYYDRDHAVQYADTGSYSCTFGYNDRKRLTSAGVAANTYSIAYNDRNGNGALKATQSVTVMNASGNTFTVEEDKAQTYTKIKYGDTVELETKYLSNKNVDTETDNVTGETVKYTYGEGDSLWLYRVKDDSGEIYGADFHYNTDGNLYLIKQSGKTDIGYSFYYDREFGGKLTHMRTAGSDIYIGYDKLGRYTGRSVTYGNKQILSESIEYKHNTRQFYTPAGGSREVDSQLTLPEKISYKSGSITYTYDDSGNITNIADSDGILTTYAYDKANRLKREDIVSDNRSYIYVYDLYGNITKKQEYYYNGSLIKTNEYAYTNGRLTAFNNETISYDIMGNPETYRGYNLSWEKGKRLISFGSNTFKYDGRGRRTKKNGVSYYYDYNDRLIASSDGMQYFYDHIGVAGFKYNGAIYLYQRDIQNNVKAILDSNGNTVVQYVYDAWGNHTVSGSNTTLGNLNPFRYRSYFYDTETRLYYLKTRYYDPETGRFLNMDSIQYADPEAINGLNLYAYCGNNPVMNVDPEGNFVSTVLGAIFGGIWGAITSAIQGKNVWKGMLIGAATGALAGLAVDAGMGVFSFFVAKEMTALGVTLGVGLSGLGGLISGGLGDIASQMFVDGLSWGEVDKLHALAVGGITAATNIIGFGISAAANGLGQNMPKWFNPVQRVVASLNPVYTPLGSWIGQGVLGFGISVFPSLNGFKIKSKNSSADLLFSYAM